MASTQNTNQYTTHLVSSNHSLGYVTGLTRISSTTSQPQCHYFGGLPYALPPIGPHRFRRPRSLPSCYRYGTSSNPGNFTGNCGVCPQPGFMMPSDEATWDEDCLQCNIWIPVGTPPPNGWPVLFYIHGGWLQHGTPNATNPVALLGETACQCIIVCPAYRVNVFGFLASEVLGQDGAGCDAVGNFGFWDQRLALEWTWKWISYFGGDPSCITVGGYSAGAHSTFYQLSHDLSKPPHKRIIKRAILFSNGPGLQPKPLASTSTKDQFIQLLKALSISSSLSPSEILNALRNIPAKELVDAASSISLHEFRGITEPAGNGNACFVSASLFEDIDSGVFAKRLRESGTQILLGECRDEYHIYGAWRPPKSDSFDAMRTRLCADYAPEVVDAVLDGVYCPWDAAGKRVLPVFGGMKCGDWSEAFGKVYAELQVHCLERGFVARMHEHGAEELVRRYRIEWRAQCVNAMLPSEWGVTHGSDVAVWFWGMGLGLKDGEKEVCGQWLRPFWEWVLGRGWGDWIEGPKRARRLRGDGRVDVWEDDRWEHGVRVWDVARKAQTGQEEKDASRL